MTVTVALGYLYSSGGTKLVLCGKQKLVSVCVCLWVVSACDLVLITIHMPYCFFYVSHALCLYFLFCNTHSRCSGA